MGQEEPRVADIILWQLGGRQFQVMTGSNNFLSDGNMLCMTLARNRSEANRLHITLEMDDTYTLRFFHFTPSRLNSKTLKWSEENTREIAEYKGIYAEDLCRIFTSVTGLETQLYEGNMRKITDGIYQHRGYMIIKDEQGIWVENHLYLFKT